MKQRFLIIILLFFFLFSVPIVLIFLEVTKNQIKKEIKNKIIFGISKNELTFLKFSKKEAQIDLEWEHSKEFEYKGEMYDIVYSKENNDSVFYWCWLDNEETSLNKKVNYWFNLIWNNYPLHNDTSKRLTDFLKTFYFTDNIKKMVIQFYCSAKIFSFDFNFYKSLKLSVPELPPWF